MKYTVGGVEFESRAELSGDVQLSVAAKSKDCVAVEFIVEAADGSWASGVLAVRSGVGVSVPRLNGGRSVVVRLFNDVGKEVNRGARELLEIGGPIGQRGSGQATSTPSGRAILIGVVAVIVVAYLFFGPFTSRNTTATPTSRESSTPLPSLAILSRSANLRSSPALLKDNVLSALPFGTQLFGLGQSGDFLEVQVFGGSKGFVHKDVAADATRVRNLGLKDSLEQAKLVPDDKRVLLLAAANEMRSAIFGANLLDGSESARFESVFQAAVSRSSGDEVAGRYFHYLAEEAAARRNLVDAVAYFRAAALSNPLSVTDVHGWGITQLRLTGSVEETAALHAAAIAPRSTNTWVMVAGYLAGHQAGVDPGVVAAALRVAVGLSSDRSVTKRFLSELNRSTSNSNMQAALVEVIRGL